MKKAISRKTLPKICFSLAVIGFVFSCGSKPVEASLEVGRTLYGTDDSLITNAPVGGTLFCIWTKIPDTISTYPFRRGNMDVYYLFGNNWHLRCLTGNCSMDSADTGRYNANSMLFADPPGTWISDYSYYESPQAPAQITGWVWAAWQVVVYSDSMTLRQWLKFGPEGEVMEAGESTPSFAQMRDILVDANGWSRADADAWTPGHEAGFYVGRDHGFVTRAKMFARSDKPTLAELNAMALRTSADGEAWADYPFVWRGGQAFLRDQSGHGRDLSLESGGTLYQGVPGPQL